MRNAEWTSPDGLIQLHHCRCEDLLAGMEPKSVDVVVTSPPYNTLQGETGAYGFRANRQGGEDRWLKKQQQVGYADSMPEPVYQAWLNWIVGQLVNVTKGPVWVNHKLRYREDEGVFPVRFIHYKVWNRVIWWRRGSMAQNCRKFKPSTEEIYAFGSRGYWSGEDVDGALDVWSNVPDDSPDDVWGDVAPERGFDEHACPWPVEIPLRLVRATCPPGGTTLDCFMGRATAAVACIRAGHGRKFIGCDSSERSFQAAVRFIQAEYERTALFDAERKSQQTLVEDVA